MLSFLLLLVSPFADDTTYWQQRVAYQINASLAESTGVLTGKARIRYVNQSPDTLHDFSVHQYLNAFRPGSRWAAADSAEQRDRFQHLTDPDYAFERITNATVMGEKRAPDYPYAPDSTIAHWSLPRPLAPGDSFDVEIDWQARPSTLPRRQGRQGRRFDFAQWYPKVVVYDKYGWQDHPLYPGGEFYGEFGSFDVTLDLPADQVIGATGVPLEGDPGWDHAKVDPNLEPDMQREWYRAPRSTRRCSTAPAQGRKCVRFYADSVHHFAFSLNPQYRYEEGRYGDVVVRVLYQPGDTATWGKGIAVHRTEQALQWLDSLFGKFAWPQITNVHRIEGGGTEFPMMVMNGSASLGLILHEVGHNYTMGILANNEWREGWLDEGFTSFQTGWYFESHGQGPAYQMVEGGILFWDLERWSEPVSMVSDEFRDFTTYNTMIYTKAHLLYEQLRYIVGDDVMRQILRTYYARWRLKHVDEDAFREVVEDVSRLDLKWLFAQWLHGNSLIDYRLDKVERYPLDGGRWRTVVTISRLTEGRMPIEIGDGDEVFVRASGQPETERVEFITDHQPGRLVLDPRLRSHDWNLLNNREQRPFVGRGARLVSWDDPTRHFARRDRIVTGLFPLLWKNDHAQEVLALRIRENYLDRFNRNLVILSVGTGTSVTNPVGIYARFGDPVKLPMPRTEASIAFWNVEGRTGMALRVDRSLKRHLSFGADPHIGFDAIWMATTDLRYVDRSMWDDAGTIEIGPWLASSARGDNAVLRGRVAVRAGLVYRNPGLGVISQTRYDVEAFGRFTTEASLRQGVWGTTLGVRFFAGAYLGDKAPPRQRRIPIAGADPYETFTNPLLRSRGALFARGKIYYHAPGNANLRAYARDLGGRWAISVNIEDSKTLFRRGGGLFNFAAIQAFVDAGMVDTRAVPSIPPGGWYTPLWGAGLGIVTHHQVQDLGWTLRFDFPLLVARYDYASNGTSASDGRLAFRWVFSLEPSF
jgi:hypothetical protein